MSKRTRSPDGTHAKHRRARIARRLVMGARRQRDMQDARQFLALHGSPAEVTGYDRRTRTVRVAVTRPVYAKDIKVTIGFVNPTRDAEGEG